MSRCVSDLLLETQKGGRASGDEVHWVASVQIWIQSLCSHGRSSHVLTVLLKRLFHHHWIAWLNVWLCLFFLGGETARDLFWSTWWFGMRARAPWLYLGWVRLFVHLFFTFWAVRINISFCCGFETFRDPSNLLITCQWLSRELWERHCMKK